MAGDQFTHEAAWFQALVERMDDIVFALDGTGRFVYGNSAMQQWLGVDPVSLLGSDCLHLIHPDDRERAIESIAYVAQSDQPITPSPFRALAADGSTVYFDIMAHPTLHDPTLRAMVFVARETSDQNVVDSVVELLVTQGDFEETLLNAVQLMRRPLWSVECGVYYQDEDGAERLVHTGIPPEIVHWMPDAGEAPWTQARTTGEAVQCVGLEQLPADLADIARRHGFVSCWAEPVTDPMHPSPACFVLWLPDEVAPELGQGKAWARATRLVELTILQRYQQGELLRAARIDRLTGLANRGALMTQLDALLAEGERSGHFVLYIDLDDFKPVNDRFGHAAGDAVLVEVARRISSGVGPYDVVARIGGDEFAVLTDATATPDAALELASGLVERIIQPIAVETTWVQVSASVGVAPLGDPHDTADLAVDRADRAMYAAKHAGRNQVQLG
jgi:diguanylate cyclase (GGDEF)-like protein/PAS domain S-box-containing protein